MDNVSRVRANLACLPKRAKMVGLDLEQAGLHDGRAAQPPQQAGQPQHQFPFYRRLCVIVGDDGGLEGPVVVGIFQRTDDGLGGEAVADRIAAGALLAFLSNRTGAVTGIARLASICLKLVMARPLKQLASFCDFGGPWGPVRPMLVPTSLLSAVPLADVSPR